MAGNWLSLKVSAQDHFDKPLEKSKIVIFVPKKILPLSTDRNRLRRVIKEAIRTDFSMAGNKQCFMFRVIRKPGKAGLAMAKEAVKALQTFKI